MEIIANIPNQTCSQRVGNDMTCKRWKSLSFLAATSGRMNSTLQRQSTQIGRMNSSLPTHPIWGRDLLTIGLMEIQRRAAGIAAGDRGTLCIRIGRMNSTLPGPGAAGRQLPVTGFQVYRGRSAGPAHPSLTVSKNGPAPDSRVWKTVRRRADSALAAWPSCSGCTLDGVAAGEDAFAVRTPASRP
jgi:hypothetical protein